MERKLSKGSRRATKALLILLFITMDSIGHRLRECSTGELGKGLDDREQAYLGKLADATFQVAEALRKFQWRLR